MTEENMSVNLECPKCHVAPHVEDENDDSSMVFCPQCGDKFGTLRDVKALAMNAAKEKAQDMLADAFKGLKGWKVERR